MTALRLAGVDAYYGRAHVLSGVGFAVGPGEAVALLGRNGAGKSTIFKTVMGLLRAARGAIEFQGRRIEGLPPHRIARLGLGYVPEDRRIFAGLTVMENLEVGRRPAPEGVAAWTPERLFELFPNLTELRHRPAGRISGGEQQMLAIARTLMGNPALLLLDEPSEGLAPLIVEQMAGAIRALKSRGVGVLLAEQNLRFAESVADRAVIVETGRVRYAGSMAELGANPEIRAQYLAV